MLSVGFYRPLGHKNFQLVESNTFAIIIVFGFCGTVLSIKNTEKFRRGWWIWGCKWKNLGKKDRCITRSEHKQYFNESYVE